MKPLIYSLKSARESNIGWVHEGKKFATIKTILSDVGANIILQIFTVDFPHDDDTVFMAYCFPYTYSDLQRHLCALEKDRAGKSFSEAASLSNARWKQLRFAHHHFFCGDAASLKARKGVVITARVHPGESNSSYMMKGVIDYLTGPSLDAKILRDNFVFKVIPMLNPDGVIVGNYRCSLQGST